MLCRATVPAICSASYHYYWMKKKVAVRARSGDINRGSLTRHRDSKRSWICLPDHPASEEGTRKLQKATLWSDRCMPGDLFLLRPQDWLAGRWIGCHGPAWTSHIYFRFVLFLPLSLSLPSVTWLWAHAATAVLVASLASVILALMSIYIRMIDSILWWFVWHIKNDTSRMG